MKLFGGTSNPIITEEVCHYLGVDQGKITTKEAIWVTDEGIKTGGVSASIGLSPEKFYRKICTVIKEDKAIEARYLKEIQVEVLCGDKYFKYYKLRQEIGWNERLGEELNLDNAIGLFSCIGKVKRTGLKLNYETMDSLASGQYTKHLKFRQW